MFKRITLIYLTAALIIPILSITLVTDLSKIRSLQDIQKADAQLSLVWFLNQADREARNFLQHASYLYMGQKEASKQQVMIKFDIFWSRYDAQLMGRITRKLSSIDSGVQFLEQTRHVLSQLDPLVQKLTPANSDTYNSINLLMTEHLQGLYALSINAIHHRSAIRADQHSTIDQLYFHLQVTLLSLFIGGLVLIALFLKKGRELTSQNLIFERRVKARTKELSQSNQSLLFEAEVRKKSEQRSQQLISAFDQSKELVFFLDAKNCFIFFNESFKQINSAVLDSIALGAPFEIYLKAVMQESDNTLTSTEKQQWIENWLLGLRNSDDSHEIQQLTGQQFIFNMNRLEDGSVITIGSDISTLKQTQQALAMSESRFRDFALIGADWYWEMDAELKFTFVAGSVEKTSGLPPEHYIGKTRAQAYTDDFRPHPGSEQSELEQMSNREAFNDYQIKTQGAGGRQVTVSLSGEPRYDQQGDFSGYIGAGRDVTERTLVEELDKRLIAAINSLSLFVTIFDDQDKLIFFNRQFGEAINKDNPNIVLGMRFEDMWLACCEYYAREYGFDTQHWYDKRLAMHRNPVDDFVLPLGEHRYLKIFEQLLDDGGVIIIATDISESTKAGQEIHRLRNYLANIIDSMSSILIGVDQQCRITQWNFAAQQETSLSLDNAYQRDLVEVFPRLQAQLASVVAAINNRQESSHLKRLYLKAGEVCYEDITIYPLITSGESGAVIRLDNVTEQVLLSEMMIQSEKMLSVGGLAAGMAHEINNPLAGMMQTADVMLNRLTAENIPANLQAATEVGISMQDVQQYMQNRGILRMISSIIESGNRVAVIVDNMLNFSRQNDAQSSQQNLAKLLDKALELSSTDYNLKNNFDFKSIKILKHYQPDMPEIFCEPGKIQQVFLNILRNGAQAMQEANVSSPAFVLRIRYDAQSDEAIIDIEDNGPGMEEGVKRRIFEPFFTTKKEGAGTGLGLSVSYFIITENHAGRLLVDSVEGNHCKFTICLPRMGNRENIEKRFVSTVH